ncbi:flagellar hook protein FlgL [Salipiger pallidus]|uniref:Flagellar hook protein FlgL n=1 Tax=Salipiger pallidus TaxID=1775170 RepID=A0A8J3EHG9_9RHOB|nr:flagellin [Salipiger pallidus]GGG78751.1 flagellar hook protein FlgL [Salipiger pallidus]
MDTVGDLARTLVLRTHQTRLNSELDKLGVEIATGFVRDSAEHLGGDITSLLSIDRSLAKLDAFRLNTSEASFLTSTMQNTLGEIQDRMEHVSGVLVSAELIPNDEMIRTMSEESENALAQTLNGLNRSVAGRFLFSGTATNSPPLIDAETMMSELRTLVSGETTASGIGAQIDAWFETAGGGFETTAYNGSTTSLAPMQLSTSERASIDIRADDMVFRDTLKAFAKASLASDEGLAISTDEKVNLLFGAAIELQSAQGSMVEVRAGLGVLEQRIEEATTRNAAERTATSIARLDLVGIDEFETATRYENTRSQLESLYAITVRSSRMSLVGYL